VAETSEPVGWILSFGTQVQVMSPKCLREKLGEEAKKVLGLYR